MAQKFEVTKKQQEEVSLWDRKKKPIIAGCIAAFLLVAGIIGGILAVGNFFFMAIASDAAADKAVDEQDVSAGKKAIKLSYTTRLMIIGVLMFVLAKSGHCHVIAMACPLFFVFPVIMVIEFFRKAGGNKA